MRGSALQSSTRPNKLVQSTCTYDTIMAQDDWNGSFSILDNEFLIEPRQIGVTEPHSVLHSSPAITVSTGG